MGNDIFLPQSWEHIWARRQSDLNALFAYILKKPDWEATTLDDLFLATTTYQQSVELWFEYHNIAIVWANVAPCLHAIRQMQVHLRQIQSRQSSYTCDGLLDELKNITAFARENTLQIHGLRSMTTALEEIITRYKNDY